MRQEMRTDVSQMANKHMKKCSAQLVIEKLELKQV